MRNQQPITSVALETKRIRANTFIIEEGTDFFGFKAHREDIVLLYKMWGSLGTPIPVAPTRGLSLIRTSTGANTQYFMMPLGMRPGSHGFVKTVADSLYHMKGATTAALFLALSEHYYPGSTSRLARQVYGPSTFGSLCSSIDTGVVGLWLIGVVHGLAVVAYERPSAYVVLSSELLPGGSGAADFIYNKLNAVLLGGTFVKRVNGEEGVLIEGPAHIQIRRPFSNNTRYYHKSDIVMCDDKVLRHKENCVALVSFDKKGIPIYGGWIADGSEIAKGLLTTTGGGWTVYKDRLLTPIDGYCMHIVGGSAKRVPVADYLASLGLPPSCLINMRALLSSDKYIPTSPLIKGRHTTSRTLIPDRVFGDVPMGMEWELIQNNWGGDDGSGCAVVVEQLNEISSGYCGAETDSSILLGPSAERSPGAHGYEVVTRPTTLTAHRAVLERAADLSDRIRVNDSCGVHVHVDRRAVDKVDAFQFFWMYGVHRMFISTEKNTSDIAAAAATAYVDSWGIRYNNRYAINVPRSADVGGSVVAWRNTVPTNGRTPGDGWFQALGAYITDRDRHQALNITNPTTLEVRVFKSTTDTKVLSRYLQIVHASVGFTNTYCYTPQRLSLGGFARYILRHKKLYPALIEAAEEIEAVEAALRKQSFYNAEQNRKASEIKRRKLTEERAPAPEARLSAPVAHSMLFPEAPRATARLVRDALGLPPRRPATTRVPTEVVEAPVINEMETAE